MIQTADAIASPSLVPSGEAARLAIRRGVWTGATAGLAAKCVQAHVVILPAAVAADFRDYCTRNPQACSLLAVSEPGQAMLPTLGDDIDVRCDVPAYQIWRDGEPNGGATDIVSIWRRDLVTFVIAASFSFEQTWAAERFDREAAVPVYVSQVPTATVGAFGGPLRVAMRALRADSIIRSIEVGTRLGEPHGTPMHIGNPASIGIDDLARPEMGEARVPAPDELPVFWASGLTAQAAALRARTSLCITNLPGAMLVTDLLHRQIAASATMPESASRFHSRVEAALPAEGSASIHGWR